VQEAVEQLLGPVGEKQRDLSRDVIKPTVKEHMALAYQQCAMEAGPGSVGCVLGPGGGCGWSLGGGARNGEVPACPGC
jgi:hypothetical protein